MLACPWRSTKSFKQLMEEAETPSRRNSGGAALPPVPSPAAAAAGTNGGLPSQSAVLAAAATKLPSLEPLVQALQQVREGCLLRELVSTSALHPEELSVSSFGVVHKKKCLPFRSRKC